MNTLSFVQRNQGQQATVTMWSAIAGVNANPSPPAATAPKSPETCDENQRCFH